MKRLLLFVGCIVGCMLIESTSLTSQPSTPPEGASKKPKETPFTEAIEGYTKIEGLFTFYWKESESKLLMEIKPEQFNLLYLCSITRQSGDAYLFDGSSQIGEFPFVFQRVGNRIMLLNKNVSFRADSNEVTARTIKRNMSNSLVGSAKISILPNPTGGGILVDAEPFFIQDVALVGAMTDAMKMNFSLDKENSFFAETKSFPLNTEIEINLHFKSSKPQRISTLPDSRSMMHRYHYSIAAIPQSPGFTPRKADDRVGHFTTIFQDYSDLMLETPYKRFVNRWNLEKENPDAKLSKPKQPIVYWLENTIPLEYREWVKEGVLMWNSAFERIGFQDAIVVQQMPDTADWDPADARYNTIRWMIQPGGGYAVGPSRANPFTGQLYDADIRISADFLRHMHREFSYFINPLTSHNDENSINEFNGSKGNNAKNLCSYAEGGANELAFGLNMLSMRTGELSPELKEKYVHEYVVSLVAHEVGHTLGLRHNFKASSIYTLDQLHDPAFTRLHGTSGSVMDYHAVNLAPKGKKQGDFYHLVLGDYDYWAIEYAYKQYDKKEFSSENDMLESIAAKSTNPELIYATDEDCFGNSTRGIDPTATLFDLSSTPLDYYVERMDMAQELWKSIPKKLDVKGNRFQQYRMMFGQGIGEYFGAARGIPRYIGGIYTNRARVGNAAQKIPYTVVPAAEQRKALQLLTSRIFSAGEFTFAPDLLNRLAGERDQDFEGTPWSSRLDYPVHSTVSAIQSSPFGSLYSVNVLTRLQDNEVRFAAGEQPFTMAEMFASVRDAIWSEVAKAENINSYRRELQRDHLNTLSLFLVKPPVGTPNDAIALARMDLSLLKKQIESAGKSKKSDAVTKAHLEEIAAKIDASLKAQIQTGM
ncbi:MAG: zinc-dependent metalloprotease [Ignavibacteria bacterium]|nr:zinc-dependent metalloprotease [Ignavibacteria bacterium]